MTDIRTKALALAALKNEVQIGWDELRDCYVAVIDNRKVAVSEEIDIGLIELYAEAAKVLGLEPDPVVMELFETCKAALEHFGLDWGLPGSWRDRLCRKLHSTISKARGEVESG